MKKIQRIEESIMQILNENLQLDMPHPVKAKRIVVNEIIELISNKEHPIDQPEIDISTPFFGNSGAKIPMKQPDTKKAEEILDKHTKRNRAMKVPEGIITTDKRLIYAAMEEYTSIVERRSCKKCAMAWTKKDEQKAILDELIKSMQEVIRISDRNHNAWDKTKELINEYLNQKQ